MLSHRNILFQLEYADFITPLREGDQQLSFLPLCHVAERTFLGLQPALHRRHRELRREHRHGAREHPRSRPRALLRGAADLGEVLLRVALRMRDATWLGRFAYDRAIRIGLRLAACRIEGAGRRGPSGPPSGWPTSSCSTRQALDRAAPGPRRGHRRRPDRPRPDPLVPGARARHVRGLRPDREHRPRHRDAAQPHQARDGGGGASGDGSAPLPPRARSSSRARTCSWATTANRRRPRRPSWTDGCTPATLAPWTPTASSASPTA